MNKLVFLSVLVALLIGHRQYQWTSDVSPFSSQQYAGRWYEIKRYDTETQTGGDSTVTLYTLATPQLFNVEYHMQVGPQPIQINGQLAVSFPNESPLLGMLSLSFGGAPLTTSNYWILGTDFVNYSVVWFCQNVNATHSSETACVLSRQRTIPTPVEQTVDGIINQFLVPALLRPTVQNVARCGN